jgi:D-glycero-D-manno-heptose 1,7-bisphosphate phosphatase
MNAKALFLDRDGVINELVYHAAHGIVGSPFTVEQFKLLPNVCEAITKFRTMGYKVILVSNQPDMSKGRISRPTFEKIKQHMLSELTQSGAALDAEYYCFHHPEATVDALKIDCECRKPKPGLLLQAAQDMGIDLHGSWMIGDGLTDIQAGKSAGCRTILIGRMKCELCSQMDENDVSPDAVCAGLSQACDMIKVAATSRRST